MLEQYSERLLLPSHGSNGIAVLSRLGPCTLRQFTLTDLPMPSIELEIHDKSRAKPFCLVAVHTRSPNVDLDRELENETIN